MRSALISWNFTFTGGTSMRRSVGRRGQPQKGSFSFDWAVRIGETVFMPRKIRVEYPWSSFEWYLAAPEHRPGWIRVDRLLGEHGIGEDSPVGRREFEQQMEARRFEANEGTVLKSLRRGWFLGGEDFRKQLLERMDGQLGEHHSGEMRRETAEMKAERIIAAELKRLDWQERDLASRRKSDPDKLALGNLLRQQTTLSIKWIAARLHLGTSKGANANLHRWRQSHRESPSFSAPPAGRIRVSKAIKRRK